MKNEIKTKLTETKNEIENMFNSIEGFDWELLNSVDTYGNMTGRFLDVIDDMTHEFDEAIDAVDYIEYKTIGFVNRFLISKNRIDNYFRNAAEGQKLGAVSAEARRSFREFREYLNSVVFRFEKIANELRNSQYKKPVVSAWKYSDRIEIFFDYIPEIVASVKTISGRKFNPDGKYWMIPVSSEGELNVIINRYNR